jgi:hypothetical protein
LAPIRKRITWKVGDLVNIRLREDLHTIGKMLTGSAMRFYNLRNTDENWDEIDFNQVSELFTVFVGNVVVKKLAIGKIDIDGNKIKSDSPPAKNLWIKPYTIIDDGHYKGKQGDFPFIGGKLIDLGDGSIGTTLAPVIKEDLSASQDREIIEKYELTNMWGDEDLSDRLLRYFDKGINRDDLKYEVFPGLWEDRETMRPLTRRLPVPLR